MTVAEALDCITWYVRCLEDIQHGRVVRGLAEAKAGYDTALGVFNPPIPCCVDPADCQEGCGVDPEFAGNFE